MNRNILIIGGAGFVGANLAVYFKGQNDKVTVVDNLVRRGSEQNLKELSKLGIPFIHGDIRNKEDFEKIPHLKYHILLCAAQPSAVNYSNPEFDIQNNTVGVLNTLEYCRATNSSLIFWSTNKCYSGAVCNSGTHLEYSTRYEFGKIFNEETPLTGKDRSIYGVSKLMADVMVQEWADAYHIPAIINRFSCLAGPRQWGLAEQGWVTWFAIANELQLPIDIFGFKGKQVRDCLFADDLCNLIDKQINSIQNHYGSVFNVGGGLNNTISLLEAIELLESRNKKFHKISFHSQERRADQISYISDIAKVYKAFDWYPTTSISDGYAQILDWVKNNKQVLESMYK